MLNGRMYNGILDWIIKTYNNKGIIEIYKGASRMFGRGILYSLVLPIYTQIHWYLKSNE